MNTFFGSPGLYLLVGYRGVRTLPSHHFHDSTPTVVENAVQAIFSQAKEA
jgi:hypothetical protein